MMKINKIASLIAVASLQLGFFSCSNVDIPASVSDLVQPVSELTSSAVGRTVTLAWSGASDAQEFQVYCNGTLVANVPGGTYSVELPNQPRGVDLAYTIKALYADGIVSNGTTIHIEIEAVPAKVALLLPCNSIDDLEDDDEIASAKWFAETKFNRESEIITPKDIANLDPDDYVAVWINIDRVGIGYGWQNLPQSLVSDEAVAGMRKYVENGGNLFLTKHATQLVVPYGVVEERFAPGIFGDGAGGEGSDNWCMNAQIGFAMENVYDHRSHEIFAGLSTLPDYGHETFALEGPGWREDHNCLWDFNAYGLPGDPNVLYNFEQATNSSVLATWAHVVDYAVGGIIDFNNTASRGRCLAIGLSAYEFNQNTGNPFQNNVETLTRNCINYVSK